MGPLALPLMILLVFSLSALPTLSLSSTTSRSTLIHELNQCQSPGDIVERVARRVDGDADVASLVWIRLAKLLIAESNIHSNTSIWQPQDAVDDLQSMNQQIVEPDQNNLAATIELVKAASVVARLYPNLSPSVLGPLLKYWQQTDCSLEAHQLSGLQWAMASLQSVYGDCFALPDHWQQRYNALELPFCIHPNFFANKCLSVADFVNQVEFRADTIRTASNQLVVERRQTAWQGDAHVGPFLYSGKAMPRRDWSPAVAAMRDELARRTEIVYDCCLLNYYPTGDSGMRYHIDPDQGRLWDFDTAVVSIGATRRFALRSMDGRATPHSFYVLHGDVTHMFGRCQAEYQHAVKKAEHDQASRVSLVFKKTMTA